MNTTSNEAALICAQLLRQGFVHKVDFPQLELNDILLTSVRDRLLDVGMELVMNSYSDFYATKMTHESQDAIEESNNLSLKNNESAMLVILWSKLILPKRTEAQKSLEVQKENEDQKSSENDKNSLKENIAEEDIQTTPVVQQDFFKEEKKERKRKKKKKKENQIYVQLSELYAEFGKQFGSKTAFKSTITRLSNLKFIHMHNEIISEGVFLDLLIDGYQMGNEIKKSALAYKLAGVMDDEEWDEFSEDDEDSGDNEDSGNGENSGNDENFGNDEDPGTGNNEDLENDGDFEIKESTNLSNESVVDWSGESASESKPEIDKIVNSSKLTASIPESNVTNEEIVNLANKPIVSIPESKITKDDGSSIENNEGS